MEHENTMTEKSHYLDNIYVVLVEPKNPGNIGAAVRAMKNMGISHLRLVKPIEYRDAIEQKKMGYRSQEITESSEEFETLDQALFDMSLIFVATSKKGKWKKDVIYPEKAAEIIMEHNINEKIAVVFGREDSGVTIDESQTANYCITVPTAVSYPSLNLSQAVLLVLYEIYRKLTVTQPISTPKRAEKDNFERLYDNIWRLMKGILIREPEKGLFHRSLKRALNRTNWTKADIAVFDRFCKQVRWFIHNHNKDDFEGEPDDPYLPGDMENE